MPVGVPKVPFQNSEEEDDATWVDVYNRLYRARFFFLGQAVDSVLANQIIGLMVYFGLEDETQEQFLYINSPGGWVIPGVALYETMQNVSPDVNTICIGVAASMACFILLGGTITKRLAFPHARVMMHQPASAFGEEHSGRFSLELDEINQLREFITEEYIQKTGKPLWRICADLERDIFMSAEEAQSYRIIDGIAEKAQSYEIVDDGSEEAQSYEIVDDGSEEAQSYGIIDDGSDLGN